MTRLRSALARITHEMKPSRRRMTESLPSLRISMSCSYRIGSTSITSTKTDCVGAGPTREIDRGAARDAADVVGGRGRRAGADQAIGLDEAVGSPCVEPCVEQTLAECVLGDVDVAHGVSGGLGKGGSDLVAGIGDGVGECVRRASVGGRGWRRGPQDGGDVGNRDLPHPRIGGRGRIGAGGDRRGEPEYVLHEERRAHDGRGDPARAQASFDGAMLFRESIPAMLRADLALENLALRQQLALLRHHSKRPRFGRFDRTFWVWLSKRWAGWREALHVVRPETVIRWHRQGFRAFWTWKSRRGRTGRPPVGSELAELVRTMALANLLWGAPRIHGELLKLGFDVSQRTVARLMPRRRKPPSQTWRAFLRTTSPTLPPLTSSSCGRRPSVCSTCSWSCCNIAARLYTSTSPIPRRPHGLPSRSSRRSPMTRRRATSSAIAMASTAPSSSDG